MGQQPEDGSWTEEVEIQYYQDAFLAQQVEVALSSGKFDRVAILVGNAHVKQGYYGSTVEDHLERSHLPLSQASLSVYQIEANMPTEGHFIEQAVVDNTLLVVETPPVKGELATCRAPCCLCPDEEHRTQRQRELLFSSLSQDESRIFCGAGVDGAFGLYKQECC